MKHRVSLFVLVCFAFAILAIVPFAVSAQSGGKVMIAERNVFTGPSTQSGTFSIAGVLSDSGLASATFTLTPRGDDRAFIDGDHVLQGSLGTLVVRTHAMVYPFGAPRALVEGRWVVVSGTGAYEGLQGGGSVRAVGDFTTGTATIIREGAVNGS
jgi:hypothetical protein